VAQPAGKSSEKEQPTTRAKEVDIEFL